MSKDISGIFWNFEELNPEYICAQRMAELKDLAEYRMRHLQAIKEWSDPVKRAKMKYHATAEEAEGRKKLKDIPADLVAVRTGESPFRAVDYGHIYVPPIKVKWFERFMRVRWFERMIVWLKSIF